MSFFQPVDASQWPTYAAIAAALVLLAYGMYLWRPRRKPRNPGAQPNAPQKNIFKDVFFSPWPFATLTLVCGIAIVVVAETRGISFWTLLSSNQLVGGILVAIFGFVLLERLREYSQGLKSANERIDKFHDSVKTLEKEIREELQKKIGQELEKFKDYVREHSWVKKVIDESLADRFPNLRILTERAIERIANNDFETGYELMRRASNESSTKPYASPEDIEFSSFAAAFIIGDKDLAVRLHARYSAALSFDPAFVCSIVRYLALANERDRAADWIEHVKYSRLIVAQSDRFPFFVRLLPKRLKDKLNTRRALVQHWTSACIDAVDAVLHGTPEDAQEAKERLLAAPRAYRDQITLTYMIAQIETVSGTPHVAASLLEQRFKDRQPTVLEQYLYISLLRESSPVLDTEKLVADLSTLPLRSPFERDVTRIATAYLTSLQKAGPQLTLAGR
jgi:hypothetical protein